jgi:lipopolysaccharide transport system permease protein
MAVLELSDQPDPPLQWWKHLVGHRDVLLVLARKDFQTRYKRASLGVTWAVAVPLLQAAVMAIVFSKVVRAGGGHSYPIYVMSGIVPYTYFSSVLSSAVVSIVEGTGLTEKVWFPRALLVLVPALANAVGLVVATVFLIAAMPIFGVPYSARLLLLVPGIALVMVLATSLSLVLAALHVYFRDVKFLVQAALMVWLYVTPIIYRLSLVHRLQPWIEANPLTGVVTIFHMATVGSTGPWVVPVVVSVAVSGVLLALGYEVHRRHDRLFVDLL